MRVWGGSIHRGQGRERNVTEFFAHHEYSWLTEFTTGVTHDIAVGRLNSPFNPEFISRTNSYDLNTVCLPHWETERYVPCDATMFGFGLTNDPNCPPVELTPILNKGIVPIYEYDVMQNLISGQHIENDSRHCPVSPLLF